MNDMFVSECIQIKQKIHEYQHRRTFINLRLSEHSLLTRRPIRSGHTIHVHKRKHKWSCIDRTHLQTVHCIYYCMRVCVFPLDSGLCWCT